jgi:hypothetical protein
LYFGRDQCLTKITVDFNTNGRMLMHNTTWHSGTNIARRSIMLETRLYSVRFFQLCVWFYTANILSCRGLWWISIQMVEC